MAFVLGDIRELVTNAPTRPDLLGVVSDAAVVVQGGNVEWVGPEEDLPARFRGLRKVDAGGRAVLPGFVDAHTHCVFAGDRADEFARRLRGESYEEILAAGGGIMSTVAATRGATGMELFNAATARLDRMLQGGTTTVEIKSGYGLDIATERRTLEVIRALDERHPVDTVPTFLGAHVVPPEFRDDRDGYVELIEVGMLPVCAPLARYCDVFCDDGAFTVDEARRVLEAGRRYGLKPRLHVEQLGHSGGAALAAEVGAVSADHLDHVTEEEAIRLRDAGTIAVLLPAVALSMRTPQPPGRMLWDLGVPVAIATDCNPGTSYTESMSLVVALAALEMGLTPEEAIWSATRGGALALELPDRGWVVPGAPADLVVLDAPSSVHIPYRPGTNLVGAVLKRGAFVVDRLNLQR